MSHAASPPVRIVGAAYPSFYVADFPGAVAFWSALLGPPEYTEPGANQLAGFRIGDTWLTLFPSSGGPHPSSAPRSCEFALRVESPHDVDRLHAALVALGAVSRMAPQDTWMYQRMRYACVDDPFGVRVDVYCPLASPPGHA